MCSQSPKEPTILFLIPGDMRRQTGGSLYNRELAEGLAGRGCRMEIVTLPDLPYLAGVVAALVIGPLLFLRFARRKYDVVIEDGWAHPTTFLFNVACRLTGKARLVIIVHQVRWHTIKPPVRFIARMIERLALRSAQLIVAVSAFISGEVEGLVGSNVRITIASPGSAPPSGSRCARTDSGDEPLRLLFVGNCTRIKGLDHLIEALSLLQDVDITLDVVGDVSLEPGYFRALARKTQAMAVDERVTFHGAISRQDLGSFYSKADIFTFSSLYEGFGIVLGEAMHAGLPIVATRTGPVHEIVSEGENALLVPPANSAALAGAIRKLAADSTMRKDFGRRSLELAGSLPTWKQTADIVCNEISIMIRTTPGTRQKRKTIPTP